LSGGPRAGSIVLAATIAVVALAMVVYQDWWTLPLLLFGALVQALDRRGVALSTALGIGAALAGSVLAVGVGLVFVVLIAVSQRAACGGPSPCPIGGVVGLIASVWWLVRTWRTSGGTQETRARRTD
jgi:hypothetical protein